MKSNKECSDNTEIFFSNFVERKNPHLYACSFNEKYGLIKDYSLEQEKRDLENFKFFINSSERDELNKILLSEDNENKNLIKKILRKNNNVKN